MKANYKNKHNRQAKPAINKIVFCDECKYEFSMNTVNIENANVVINGQELILVYFACPKCKKIYRIMLKDDKCYVLNVDLEIAKDRMQKTYKSGNKEFARTLNSMVLKKQERLKNHLSNMDKKFPGTFTFVASENNHKDKIIKYLP